MHEPDAPAHRRFSLEDHGSNVTVAYLNHLTSFRILSRLAYILNNSI